MRLRLPARYLVQPFEIYRTGFIDFSMCMRVKLTRNEAEAFVADMFEEHFQGVARQVDFYETQCPADFWPPTFGTATLAYEVDWTPPPFAWIEGTSGAVYEGGYLYFWSNSM